MARGKVASRPVKLRSRQACPHNSNRGEVLLMRDRTPPPPHGMTDEIQSRAFVRGPSSFPSLRHPTAVQSDVESELAS